MSLDLRQRGLMHAVEAALRGIFFALLPFAAGAGALAIAPLLGLAGAPSLPRAARAVRDAPAPVWLFCAFVGWAALSSAWSAFHDHGQALRLAATVALGAAFVSASPIHAQATRFGAVGAVTALAMLLLIEGFAGMPLNRLAQPDAVEWVLMRNPGRGASVLVVIVWAALGALLLRRSARALAGAGALALAALLVSTQFGMDANWLAFLLGATLFAFAYLAPRLALQAISTASAAWLLAAPFAVPLLVRATAGLDLPHSWRARDAIWSFAAARTPEHFWFGFGLDGPRAFTDTITIGRETMRAVPLHPHSISLQIWLETGFVGAALAAVTLIMGGATLARLFANQRVAAAAAAATLGAGSLIANVSYGAWQEWWDATLLAAAGLCAALASPSNEKSRDFDGELAPRGAGQ